jgi:CubicO group peptidase (beta-lactamase class C family)
MSVWQLPSSSAQSERDYWPTHEWRTVTPEAQGMNSSRLNDMITQIELLNYNVDSVSIIRNGYLVFHELPSGNYDGVALHIMASVTKSIASLLVGIAIDMGYITSLNQKIIDFFPNRTIANMDARKENWTLEHLLTMTSGLSWDESSNPYDSPLNSFYQLSRSANWIQHMLDLPMVSEPGAGWAYNSGSSFLLSPIIELLTNMTFSEFAEENLFGPLGITNYQWHKNPNGYDMTNGGLDLGALDLAKIGHLLLNNGFWDGLQVVSSEWVAESTSTHYTFTETRGYGYLWWTLPDIESFDAKGALNQHLIVSPENDLVVAVTADIQSGNPIMPLFRDYILPAIIGDTQSIPFYVSPAITLTLAISIAVLGVIVLVVVLMKRR